MPVAIGRQAKDSTVRSIYCVAFKVRVWVRWKRDTVMVCRGFLCVIVTESWLMGVSSTGCWLMGVASAITWYRVCRVMVPLWDMLHFVPASFHDCGVLRVGCSCLVRVMAGKSIVHGGVESAAEGFADAL